MKSSFDSFVLVVALAAAIGIIRADSISISIAATDCRFVAFAFGRKSSRSFVR